MNPLDPTYLIHETCEIEWLPQTDPLYRSGRAVVRARPPIPVAPQPLVDHEVPCQVTFDGKAVYGYMATITYPTPKPPES